MAAAVGKCTACVSLCCHALKLTKWLDTVADLAAARADIATPPIDVLITTWAIFQAPRLVFSSAMITGGQQVAQNDAFGL
jgi:hypothetical protein